MKKILNIAIALAIVFISACKKETEESPKNNTNSITQTSYIKIGETWITGAAAKATVYAERELLAGYNKLHIKFTDSLNGSELTEGHFSILPLMDMGGMIHSTPIDNPDSAMSVNGFYNPNITFIMSGSWSLKIRFHNNKVNTEGIGELSVNVAPVNPTKIKSVVGPDSNTVFISYVQPTNPQVGINDFEIVVHQMKNNDNFPAITDYTVEINPEMPSMGHGSPNNINPLHTANGHYKGKVNFTMTGLWRIHVTMKKNGSVIGEPVFFDITF